MTTLARHPVVIPARQTPVRIIDYSVECTDQAGGYGCANRPGRDSPLYQGL